MIEAIGQSSTCLSFSYVEMVHKGTSHSVALKELQANLKRPSETV